MRRVCVVGDSHIAAIKTGWGTVRKEYPDTEIVFRGAPAKLCEGYVVSTNALVPGSEKLRDFVRRMGTGSADIESGYDAYVVCGLEFSIFQFLRVLNVFRLGKDPTDRRAPISRACLTLAVKGCFAESLAIRTATKLLQIAKGPIHVLPTPLPNRKYAKANFARLQANGEAEVVSGMLDAVFRELEKDVDVKVHPQPAETVEPPIHTANEYCTGSVRFMPHADREHEDAQDLHANSLYGALVVRQMAEQWFAPAA